MQTSFKISRFQRNIIGNICNSDGRKVDSPSEHYNVPHVFYITTWLMTEQQETQESIFELESNKLI